ncbi:hypothetical protein QL285_026593 [Trifolium repens]|nr:hypothetical protein QL285_026593 [Trifolium repens]
MFHYMIDYVFSTYSIWNGLNMYLNPRVYSSIFTEGKNSTRGRGGEDHEVAVPKPFKMESGLLQSTAGQIASKCPFATMFGSNRASNLPSFVSSVAKNHFYTAPRRVTNMNFL